MSFCWCLSITGWSFMSIAWLITQMPSTLFITFSTLSIGIVSCLTSSIVTLSSTLWLTSIVSPSHSIPSTPTTLLTTIITLVSSSSQRYLSNPLSSHWVIALSCRNFCTFIYTFLFISSTSRPHFLVHFLYVGCFRLCSCCRVHCVLMLCATLLKECYYWLWILSVNCCMPSLCSLSSSNQIETRFFLSILTSTHLSHPSTQTDCTNWCSSTTLYLTHKLWMFLMANFLDLWSSWHPAKIVRNIS